MEEKVISMYANGMTVRDIQEHIEELYNYPYISKSWKQRWGELSTFFKYPEEIRRLIYITNPLESFHGGLRKVTKNRAIFPNEESLFKLLYLVIQDIAKKWTTPIKNWSHFFDQFSIS